MTLKNSKHRSLNINQITKQKTLNINQIMLCLSLFISLNFGQEQMMWAKASYEAAVICQSCSSVSCWEFLNGYECLLFEANTSNVQLKCFSMWFIFQAVSDDN